MLSMMMKVSPFGCKDGHYTSPVDTGHISLYGAIQSLKHGSLTDEDFKTTIDHFNAV